MIDELNLPATLSRDNGAFTLRRAKDEDLGALMVLLSDDAVSSGCGDGANADDRPACAAALSDVRHSPGNDVLVVTDADRSLIATFQLTVIPGLARQGAMRMQVEAVRVSSTARSTGLGSAMMRWVDDVAAPATGCRLIQLTSDAQRTDAHRFYERLGYAPSHVGFKLSVDQAGMDPLD